MSNPFDSEGGLPSVSFATKDNTTGGFVHKPVGYKVKIQVTKAPTLVQATQFGTSSKVFWDPNKKGQKTTEPNDQPVMSVVTHGKVVSSSDGTQEVGQEQALWAQKPSSLFQAIGDAIKNANVDGINVGDFLEIELKGYKQGEDTTKAAAKQYAAVLTASNAFSGEVPAAPAPPAPASAPAPPAPPAPPAAAPPAPPAPIEPKTADGYTLSQLVAAGWSKEQAISTYPELGTTVAPAAPAGPPAPPAPAADAPVETAEEKRARAMANLSPEDREMLGL